MENIKKPKAFLGRLALFTATVIWGTAFVIQKNALDSITPFWLLTIRFIGAGILMLPVAYKGAKKLPKKAVLIGIMMGFTLFLAYGTQTYGLKYTTPGKNAFLTAAYCIMVPFLNWVVAKRKPDRYNISAAFLAVVGIGLVSLSGDLTISIGDGLTLIAAVMYAVNILYVDKGMETAEPVPLTMISLFTCGICCLTAALIAEPMVSFAALKADAWWALAYLCILSTTLTQCLQAFGQKNTPPSQASLIMALESVMGVIASLLFYPDEVLTPRIALGFALIFIAVCISESKLEFLRKKEK